MSRATGPGKTLARSTPPSLLLYNFDIGGDGLKSEHQWFLRTNVVPVLRAGGSISVVGLASRSGPAAANQALSEARVRNTVAFLHTEVRAPFHVRQTVGFGESAAEQEGERDGAENERFRSVLLFLSSAPRPPEPPTDLAAYLKITELVPPADILDTVPDFLDFAGGAASVLEVFVTGVVAELLSAVDLASSFAAPFAGALAMRAGNQDADFNARCRGFWNALAHMTRPFSSPSLDRLPESQWPPVPRPFVPLSPIADSRLASFERHAREGERDGCEFAWNTIMALESKPADSLVIKGKRQKCRLSGRLLLRLLSVASHGDVAGYLQMEINRALIKSGNDPYPHPH